MCCSSPWFYSTAFSFSLLCSALCDHSSLLCYSCGPAWSRVRSSAYSVHRWEAGAHPAPRHNNGTITAACQHITLWRSWPWSVRSSKLAGLVHSNFKRLTRERLTERLPPPTRSDLPQANFNHTLKSQIITLCLWKWCFLLKVYICVVFKQVESTRSEP